MPIEIFGRHNLNNLEGARWICQLMGVDQEEFYEAIASFTGASKRLEKLAEAKDRVLYKDYAHSPSKVMATTRAVKEQYPDRQLIACLELHTYSSLNPDFLRQYRGALEKADRALVFYSPKAVAIKKLEPIDKEQIYEAFGRSDLEIFTDPDEVQKAIFSMDFANSSLLLMSSGNYGGLDLKELATVFKT